MQRRIFLSRKDTISLKRLRNAQARLLREAEGGDFTVRCGDKTWRCSAALLSQRCDFFKAATGGPFRESHTKFIELNDETKEEVDMLLLHLYTLDVPDFTDKTLHKFPYVAAESALKLGDKYNLPDLSKAGEQYVRRHLDRNIRDWQHHSSGFKATVVRRLERIWAMNYNEGNKLRKSATKELVAAMGHIIEFEPFQQLCAAQPNLSLSLLRAQVHAAKIRSTDDS